MIIVEGMDNTGKSTMTKRISERFELSIVSGLSSPEKGEPPDEAYMVNNTLDMLILNPHAVFDRFPIISEAVYGPILRGKIAFNIPPYSWSFYFEKLKSLHPLIIYCRPPTEEVFSFGHRKQMLGVARWRAQLLHRYDLWMARFRDYEKMLIQKYDFMDSIEPEKTLDIVESYIRLRGQK